jgi:ABC-type polar amino acid transport system ATPase subunit
MIIVTHEIDFAEAAADRVIFIEGGVIVEEGDAREVLEKPKMMRTEKFLRKLKSSIK